MSTERAAPVYVLFDLTVQRYACTAVITTITIITKIINNVAILSLPTTQTWGRQGLCRAFEIYLSAVCCLL
jgi:hypothetical protein